MNLKGMRLPIIFVTLALTLAALFGARWLYQNQALNRPLGEAVRAVPGVADVAISQRGDVLQVKVKAAETPELERFINDLWQAVDSVESGQKVELQISDNRTQALADAYYGFHFFLQEAVATGRYSDLPARLAQITAADKMTRGRVFVASDYVYVQLHQGGASLYEIVPRELARATPGDQSGTALHSVSVRPWGS